MPENGEAQGAGETDDLNRLKQDLVQAREYQIATNAVLGIMSGFPRDARPVLEAIAESAARLTGSIFGNIQLFDGVNVRPGAAWNFGSEAQKIIKDRVAPPGRWHLIGRAILDRAIVHLPDVLNDPEYSSDYARSGGWRGAIAVPMMLNGQPIGAIAAGKATIGLYSDSEIRLLSTFASQAVIALENARLFSELEARNRDLSESLDRERAMSEVLGVINAAPSDAQPVLEAIAANSQSLCDALFANVFIYRDGILHFAASRNLDETSIGIMRSRYPAPADRSHISGRVAMSGQVVRLEDAFADPEYDQRVPRWMGWQRVLGVPMLRDGQTIGVIVLGWRQPGEIPDKTVSLLRSFADQAVIALENTRLFAEVQARTEALEETLEYLTATAEVLGVISRSPTDAQPVFDAIATSAARLCNATFSVVYLYDGTLMRIAAMSNLNQDVARILGEHYPRPPDRLVAGSAAILEQRVIHVTDALADPDYSQEIARVGGWKAALAAPMLLGGVPVGSVAVSKSEPGPFTERQINLLKTFADQAVIAINNVNLFTRAEDRSRELAEALDQQIATAEVLKAISSSTFDLPVVLRTLVEAAARLCKADHGTIAREQSGAFLRVASHGYSREFDSAVLNVPIAAERGTATGRALVEGRVVHIPDVTADPEYTFEEALRFGGFRTILAVPMLREGVAIGCIALTRKRCEPFTDKEIDLVSTFADQAAIAIGNVRLFEAATSRSAELARSLAELRATQDRLVQTEKLASLGQLTAGIAHEIKNPLNFVNNFAAISSELVDELVAALESSGLTGDAAAEAEEVAGMLRGNLAKIVQHGARADSIVRNMLMHARQGTGERRQVDVNALVEESLSLAYHGARAERRDFNVTLERDFDPAAGTADLFPQEITRVLLNLISNGFYAVSKRAADSTGAFEPTLTVATRDRGSAVEIIVRDNGTGIPAAVRDKLFLPFFTTKPAGEGTGLGLSISHDIVVKQHGGRLEVESEPGAFTAFSIHLPRALAEGSQS